jgi:hypothetical protein
MSINIVVSQKVGFLVKGQFNNEEGDPQDFDFKLIARRMDEEEMASTQKNLFIEIGKVGHHAPVVDLLCGPADDEEKALITNWQGVKDEGRADVAFSPQRLRALLKSNRGLAGLIWRCYQNEAGAKEKN